MQIKVEMDVSRLNNAIRIAEQRAGISVNDLVRATGLFFSQSFVKALNKSKANRKTFSFEEPLSHNSGRTRTTYVIGTRKHGRFYRRTKRDLGEYRAIEHQGMAKDIAAAAARHAGLEVPITERMGQRTARVAPRYASGTFRQSDRKPSITFVYQSDDIAGFMGRQASRRAIHKTSRRILGWAGRIQRETKRRIEGLQS